MTQPAAEQRWRVSKTLMPSDRGAIELARRYGDQLVCVRHRMNARGTVRHVTVELVVASLPVRPRRRRLVGIRLAPQERDLRALIQAAGGEWDSRQRLWRLPAKTAHLINLKHRMIELPE